MSISIEDYCERVNNLENFTGEKASVVKVYKYSEVTTLSEGEVFGDVALRNSQKTSSRFLIHCLLS